MKLLGYIVLCTTLLLCSGATARPTGFRDCPECPEMARLPGGSFMLGSPDDEVGRNSNEGPQRRLRIQPFAAGRFDVTREEWKAFVAATRRQTQGGCAWANDTGPHPDPEASWDHLGFSQDDRHPVVCVTWQDAQDYVAWLRQRTGHLYRLLSEAEWEYAARAGSRGPYPWGAQASHEFSNFGAETCCSGLAVGRDHWIATSPVGSFPPNAFGLYDMHGEVLQWVQDCLHDYASTPADGRAFETPGPLPPQQGLPKPLEGMDACAFRMLRGGDWGDPPRMIRSAFRNYAPPKGATLENYRSAGAGFRVARELR
jgi:formylglycine-generating enzyme required for sulfatase activity